MMKSILKPITTLPLFFLLINMPIILNETINELISIPFIMHNAMPYVSMIVNSKGRTLSISTCLYQSILFKGQSSALDKKEESSNVYYDTYNSGPNIKVPISFNYTINDQLNTIDITDYEFILLVRKSNETIFAFQPDHYAGVLALPRRSIHYHDSLLRKLYQKKHINTITFGLNYNAKYLVIGTKEKIIESFRYMPMPIPDQDPNTNTNDTITSCMLYLLDNVLYSEWACKATYVLIGEDYFNYSSDQYIPVTLNVVFEPMINNIVIPDKYRHEILNKMLSMSVFNSECKLVLQTHLDETYYQNRINEINLKLYYIKCITTNESILTLNDFISHIQLKTLSIVINGFVYSFTPNELFKQNSTDATAYYSALLFSETNKHYAILGNMFLGKLKGIVFDDEGGNIAFINKNMPIDIQDFTHDKPEKRSAQFFLFTVICVILLIIIALLIPYYFYRRSKRKMMDRLNYEIIYRKVDDVKRSLLHSNNENS